MIRREVTVVTGALTGAGLGISRQLLKAGAEIYMSRRSADQINLAAVSSPRDTNVTTSPTSGEAMSEGGPHV